MRQAQASLSAGRAAAVAVVACTLLVAALATLAASIGPDQVLHGDGPGRLDGSDPPPTTATTSSGAEPTSSSEPAPTEGGGTPAWLEVVKTVVVGGIVVLALLGCAKLLRMLRAPRSRRRTTPDEPVDFEVLPPVSAIATVIAADAEQQHQALLSGAPRNAIVECWHRFEVQAAAAGVKRERWETSSELTQRVLTRIGADPGAVAGLAEVFREARFSRHEVGEDLRDRAVELLQELQASLRRSGSSS